jgi:hypothetical protein
MFSCVWNKTIEGLKSTGSKRRFVTKFKKAAKMHAKYADIVAQENTYLIKILNEIFCSSITGFAFLSSDAQELFVMTEPANNEQVQ